MKALLEENKRSRNRQDLYKQFWPMIPEIEKFIPESKKDDVEKIKKILREYEKEKEPAKMGLEEDNYMFG